MEFSFGKPKSAEDVQKQADKECGRHKNNIAKMRKDLEKIGNDLEKKVNYKKDGLPQEISKLEQAKTAQEQRIQNAIAGAKASQCNIEE